jgi:hypothetical protein
MRPNGEISPNLATLVHTYAKFTSFRFWILNRFSDRNRIALQSHKTIEMKGATLSKQINNFEEIMLRRSFVDTQIVDRKNVDIQTVNSKM